MCSAFVCAAHHMVEATTMMPRDLNFAHPEAAYLMLAIVLFLALFIYAKNQRKKALEKLARPAVLSEIALLPSGGLTWLKGGAFVLSWILACLALMGPRGDAEYTQAQKAAESFREDIIFMIDTSQSMAVTDTTTQESRLGYAKEIADQVARRLTDHQLMLLTFTTDAYQVVPLTDDNIFFRLSLKEIGFDEGNTPPGTDFSKAFSELETLYGFNPKETSLKPYCFSRTAKIFLPQAPKKSSPLFQKTIFRI